MDAQSLEALNVPVGGRGLFAAAVIGGLWRLGLGLSEGEGLGLGVGVMLEPAPPVPVSMDN